MRILTLFLLLAVGRFSHCQDRDELIFLAFKSIQKNEAVILEKLNEQEEFQRKHSQEILKIVLKQEEQKKQIEEILKFLSEQKELSSKRCEDILKIQEKLDDVHETIKGNGAIIQRIPGQQELSSTFQQEISGIVSLLETGGIDECSEGIFTCGPNSKCVDNFMNYTCPCLPGFEWNGLQCEDIDECIRGISNCGSNTQCSNSHGSFSCPCLPGFELNGLECEDIDECTEGTSGCDRLALCTNSEGNFSCSCISPFQGDGRTCEVDVTNCTPPFEGIDGVGCIHIIEKTQPYSDSRKLCKDLGGDLFVAVSPKHYLRLAQYFIDTNLKAKLKYMWVGVEAGVWLSGRKVAPEEEAPGNPSMGSNKCSYTDGDTSEKFLLWTDPCSNKRSVLCERPL